jgi:DNA-directed RNA polymerase specialized sigma24 family protein
LDPVLFPEETLNSFYRFALLVTGEAHAAEQLLAESLAEVEMRIGYLRNEPRRKAWLIRRLRQRIASMETSPARTPRLLREEPAESDGKEILEIEAYILAQHFAALPEPERSALALFYLKIFPQRELPELLDLELEDLASALDRGRQLLRASLHEHPSLSSLCHEAEDR